jgi:HSP20 family protein
VLSFDMPGLEKDNIDVELRGNQLVVSGERKKEREEDDGKSRLTERSYNRFERILTLPNDVKSEGIEAQYQNGVLSLAVPRTAESKSQKIKIGEGKTGFLGKILGDGLRKDKAAIDVKKSEANAPH